MFTILRKSGLQFCLGLFLSVVLAIGPSVQFSIPWLSLGAQPSVARSVPANQQNAVLYWDSATLDAIRSQPPGPPVVARVLAMVHTAQYEAWSQYDAKAVGTLLGTKYRQPVTERTVPNQTRAMSYAAYRVLVDLFPDFKDLFNYQMKDYGLDPTVTQTRPDTPAGVGNLAAAAVLAYRHQDGSNQLGDRHPGAYTDYTGYQPMNTPTKVNDLNHWQPLLTPNGSFQGGCIEGGQKTLQKYVGPHWGNVLPFALKDGEEIVPSIVPIRYPSPEFTQQAQDVLTLNANLTDQQKAIVEYWADGPSSEFPAGHWALFSQFVSQRDRHKLEQDVKLFFALSNANLDASVLAWKLKRDYDSVRPITAIRELFKGKKVKGWAGPFKGVKTIDGANWKPYQELCFVTPAFPEFLSGHSTFSAASAEVLRTFTGSDQFGYNTQIRQSRIEQFKQPITLSWPTFSEAAAQAGMSRRYGGIHFANGDLAGREVGRQVGKRAWQKAEAFWQGEAQPVADLTQQLDQFVAINDFSQLFPRS